MNIPNTNPNSVPTNTAPVQPVVPMPAQNPAPPGVAPPTVAASPAPPIAPVPGVPQQQPVVQPVQPGSAQPSTPQAVPQQPPTPVQPATPAPSVPPQKLSNYFAKKGDGVTSVPPAEKSSKKSEEQAGQSKKGGKKKSTVTSFLFFIGELAITVVLAFVVVFTIKKYVIQPFFVDGVSMEPNFHDSEYLIINELTYNWNDPQRGDVIVFRYPLNESKFYIKRIVGLPGEKIIVKEGSVSVCETEDQCEILDETKYLEADTTTDNDIDLKLEDDEYFVLGDNRDQSSDSRYWGALEKDKVIGKVWVKAYPFDKFEVY